MCVCACTRVSVCVCVCVCVCATWLYHVVLFTYYVHNRVMAACSTCCMVVDILALTCALVPCIYSGSMLTLLRMSKVPKSGPQTNENVKRPYLNDYLLYRRVNHTFGKFCALQIEQFKSQRHDPWNVLWHPRNNFQSAFDQNQLSMDCGVARKHVLFVRSMKLGICLSHPANLNSIEVPWQRCQESCKRCHADLPRNNESVIFKKVASGAMQTFPETMSRWSSRKLQAVPCRPSQKQWVGDLQESCKRCHADLPRNNELVIFKKVASGAMQTFPETMSRWSSRKLQAVPCRPSQKQWVGDLQENCKRCHADLPRNNESVIFKKVASGAMQTFPETMSRWSSRKLQAVPCRPSQKQWVGDLQENCKRCRADLPRNNESVIF